jgi:hypothetical protein
MRTDIKMHARTHTHKYIYIYIYIHTVYIQINLNVLKIYLVFENCNINEKLDGLQNTTGLTTENLLHVLDTDCWYLKTNFRNHSLQHWRKLLHTLASCDGNVSE